MSRLRELLYITNAYPPQPYAGTPRVAKTVKYLARAGVAVRVLTTHPHDPRPDPSLLPDVAGAAEVVRTARLHPGPLVEAGKRLLRLLRPGAAGGGAAPATARAEGPGGGAARIYNYLHALAFPPDETIGWLPFALPAGAAMIRRRRPDAILSTGPGHACHLIGALLARRFGLPLVLEFRDPWCGNPLRRPPTPLHARLDAALERFALRTAAGVVTIGETMSERYRARCGCPVETVRNGYDPEDFMFLCAGGGARPRAAGKAPLVAHAGTFYAGRSPRPFLEALARSRADGRTPLPRALFLGPGAEAILDLAASCGVADRVEATGPLPHDACLARLARADALLLVPGPGAATITGKVFEYLALGRPILALATPDQEVARLLAGSAVHQVVPPGDGPALDAALARALAAGGAASRPDPRFGRPFQTFRLRRFLERGIA